MNEQKTLRQEAQEYVPPVTLNIADLATVPIDEVKIQEAEKTDGENKPFVYKYFELDGKEYRVPNTVLEEIQKIIKLRPDVKFVTVTKTGAGLATRYKVEITESK